MLNNWINCFLVMVVSFFLVWKGDTHEPCQALRLCNYQELVDRDKRYHRTSNTFHRSRAGTVFQKDFFVKLRTFFGSFSQTFLLGRNPRIKTKGFLWPSWAEGKRAVPVQYVTFVMLSAVRMDRSPYKQTLWWKPQKAWQLISFL